MSQGGFIVIEGGDGAGKGSVMAALYQFFIRAGRDVVLTREPGGTPGGLALRAMLLSAEGEVWHPHAELLLMTAARIQHVHHFIRPALATGQIVLCDRFVGSTLAYQGGGRGISTALIETLHHNLLGGMQPDLTILLDVDPAIALPRSRARLAAAGADEGRFEAETLAFHQRVRTNYQSQAANPGWRVIDAAQPMPAVLHAAKTIAEAWLGGES